MGSGAVSEKAMCVEESAAPGGATEDAKMHDANEFAVNEAQSGKDVPGMAELLGHGLVAEYEAAKPERRIQVSPYPAIALRLRLRCFDGA